VRRFAPPLLASLLVFGAAVANGQAASKTADLKWGPAPAAFPAGAQMAVVSGDPGKPGPFTVQISMPDGYTVKPHTHPTDESMNVVKGTFLVGMGDKWDVAKAKPMATGATGTVPANTAHFAQAKGQTVVQVTANGPFAMTYVNPGDDPRTPPSH
jgi:quercetin dioxygenase-like cupin family protein